MSQHEVSARETLAYAPAHMSRRLWGLDWSALLPWELAPGVRVEYGTFAEAEPFVREHYASIFPEQNEAQRFLAEPMNDAKRRFLSDSDVFLFRASGAIVGLLIANPLDWSTYYLRTAALLPSHRKQGLYSRLLSRMWEPLAAAGVARVEGDMTPTNISHLDVLARQGFLVNAAAAGDRWGFTLRVTKYLRAEAHQVFLRQHCAMAGDHRARREEAERRMS